ncbi:acyl-CoA dehydrogenase family protein [Aeromicrobium alkaliterrae]|uniref:Acyl-CoA dehydrogenase family protein n=1 Tax=Aeromicrobium alkaliterrae TaxID=302168 RepID=A0ABN2K289_9ACTN
MSTTPFDWSDDQQEIRSLLRKKFATSSGTEIARAALEAGEDTGAAARWLELSAEIGLAGLTLPESVGGMGTGRVELAIVGEEMGRALVGGPYLSTVVLAAEAIVRSGDEDAAQAVLPSVAEGTTTLALAVAETSAAWTEPTTRHTDGRLTGRKQGVVGLPGADVLVVSAVDADGHTSLYLVDTAAEGVAVTPTPGIDPTRPVATVDLDGAVARPLGRPGRAHEVLAFVRENAAIFLAAEQAGGSRTCVTVTAEYARTRIQFGQPIGTFQGVKHRLADMEVRTAQAHSAAVWAAWQTPGSPEAALGADVARSWNSRAYLQNAFDTIQLHGGIGITWEHDAHLYLRRAQADAALLGPLSAEHQRLAANLGTESA